MRFVYFAILILAIINMLIVIIGGILNINIYKKYGKNIIAAIWKMLLAIIVIYIAILISGLN